MCLPPARIGPVLDTVGNMKKGDTGPHAQRAPGLLGTGHTAGQFFYVPVNIRKHREMVREGLERRLLGGGGVWWCEPQLSSKPELSVAMLAYWYGVMGDS